MSSHRWGDDWPHWESLTEASAWILKEVEMRCGCVLIHQEKYGNLRYERLQGSSGETKQTDCGLKTVADVVLEAAKKWPQCRDEILRDLAYREDLVGNKLHDEYWTPVKGELDE